MSEEIKNFLDSCKLGIYYDAFIDNGYDNIDQLLLMSKENMADLKTDVRMVAKGHILRFDYAVAVKGH